MTIALVRPSHAGLARNIAASLTLCGRTCMLRAIIIEEVTMAADKLDIDNASILDNPTERQVEFSGEVDADELQFAVQYDVLEALSGDAPEEDDAVEMFNRFSDEIAEAGLAALARNPDQPLIVISENDLE